MATILSSTLAPGETRDCVDPWTNVFVHADGEVTLCCWAGSVGNLRTASLTSILKGESAQRIRSELLRGEPGEECRRCPARGRTSPSKLRQRVSVAQRETHFRAEIRAQRLEIERLQGLLEKGFVGLWRRRTASAKRAWRAIRGAKSS
jgi:hypothetical protein